MSYEVGLDDGNPRSGGAAAYLTSTRAAPNDFANLMQSVRADDYRGRRLRWTGWVHHTEVEGDGAALWMRVDGPGATMAFDNMSARRLLGTSDWQQASVVLDVPEDAIGIAFGVLLAGPGDVIVDDLRFEVVDSHVASTDMLESPTPTESDSATVAEQYETVPSTPVNLDFEGVRLPGRLSELRSDFGRSPDTV